MPKTKISHVYVINIHDSEKMYYRGTVQKVFKNYKDAVSYKYIHCTNDVLLYVITKVDFYETL